MLPHVIQAMKTRLVGTSITSTYGRPIKNFCEARRPAKTICAVRASYFHDNAASISSKSAVGFNNYEQERANFTLTAPMYYNFAADVIDAWAFKEKKEDRVAFWWIDDNGNELKWTFTQLSQMSKRTANLLKKSCYLEPGDRVVMVLPRLPEWWLINLACIRIGCVLIPGTTQLREKDLSHRLQTSRAKVVITDHDTADRVDSIINECPSLKYKILVDESSPEPKTSWLSFHDLYNNSNYNHQCTKTKSADPMQIYFTSGTTGLPKMVEHSHASYGLAHLITARYWFDLAPSDVHWTISDPGWAKAAWGSFFAPWIQGACIFIHHSNGFDPVQVLQILERYPITTFCAAPTVYRMFVQENLNHFCLESVRHFTSAGEPLNPEVTDHWLGATGHAIREGYGQTETVLQCASHRCIPNKPGSMGKPSPGMDVKVIDENCREVGAGEEGEIALQIKPHRPIGLFTQYVDDAAKTAQAFRGDFLLTGDTAMRDEDGYFWFIARNDDVIISAGYRIGPFEVESALLEHEAVSESAVVSSPDATHGEVVKAYVVLTNAFKDVDRKKLTTDLQKHVKNFTAPYKYPRKIEYVDSLPKTVTGKLRRIALRNKEWKMP